MTVDIMPPPVIVPGVHSLTDAEYFGGELARTSLSSTGARELLVCPAKFRHRQQHPQLPKRTFDVGKAAHKLVLGDGPELEEYAGTGAGGPDAWQNNVDKAAVKAIRDRGAVPLHPKDWTVVHGMATALQEHPHAPKLLSRGKAEQSMVWRDEATGVLCRAKADQLRPDGVVDYKSTDDVGDRALTRSVYDWGYYVQAPYYLRGFRALHPDVEPFFAFIAQEKEPPYLVRVFQLTDRALTYGDRKCDEALEIYRDCTASGTWPGYPTDEIAEIDLPGWVRTEEW